MVVGLAVRAGFAVRRLPVEAFAVGYDTQDLVLVMPEPVEEADEDSKAEEAVLLGYSRLLSTGLTRGNLVAVEVGLVDRLDPEVPRAQPVEADLGQVLGSQVSVVAVAVFLDWKDCGCDLLKCEQTDEQAEATGLARRTRLRRSHCHRTDSPAGESWEMAVCIAVAEAEVALGDFCCQEHIWADQVSRAAVQVVDWKAPYCQVVVVDEEVQRHPCSHSQTYPEGHLGRRSGKSLACGGS